MIIKTLYLQNFGVYYGSHTVELEPTSEKAPIILFGGLNGGGKTTILDAIQLAFFGKVSRCSTRGNLSYEEFLRRSISRTADPREGAEICIEFAQYFDGQPHTFTLSRAWRLNGKGVSEKFEILRDDEPDEELSDRWLENIDQFIPLGLAELFFFDGEKIARLAEKETAGEMLASAINSLLGLDLVQRLEQDLVVYEREKSRDIRNSADAETIRDLEEEVKRLQSELQKLSQQCAHIRNREDRAKSAAEHAQTEFKKHGGELFLQKERFEAERNAIDEQVKRIEQALREIAEHDGPLMLVEDRISQVRDQANREEEAERQMILLTELQKRDRELLKCLSREKVDPMVRISVESFLEGDRNKRESKSDVTAFLKLSPDSSQRIRNYGSGGIQKIRRECFRLLRERSDLLERRYLLEQRLSETPDENAIHDLAKKQANTRKQLAEVLAERNTFENQMAETSRRLSEAERQLTSAMDRDLMASEGSEDVKRRIRYARKVRDTMKLFRAKVLDQKLRQIEELILEAFCQLVRKEDLVSRIHIDSGSFEMSLYGRDRKPLATDRLSAGERQLLAVSTLWGLARAGGRPLPNIIDTPLGRLDSQHRINLVETYFPNASHQVIILSTDEEIDKKHFAKLKSRIGRSYELIYSDETETTTIRPGYFFS